MCEQGFFNFEEQTCYPGVNEKLYHNIERGYVWVTAATEILKYNFG